MDSRSVIRNGVAPSVTPQWHCSCGDWHDDYSEFLSYTVHEVPTPEPAPTPIPAPDPAPEPVPADIDYTQFAKPEFFVVHPLPGCATFDDAANTDTAVEALIKVHDRAIRLLRAALKVAARQAP